MVETIQWTDAGVVMIDQTRLPREQVFVTCRTYQEVAEAIKRMVIRGAPAIGVAAAMGVALGVAEGADFETVCSTLAATRPTAVNLFWGIERMRRLHASLNGASREDVIRRMIDEAQQIRQEDIAICQAIGRNGAELVPDRKTVLTHCNAGALATAGYGTALGVIRAAISAGKKIDVLADETRPFLQGSRLTAWELQHDGIPVKLITDNMAGYFLHSGRIGCVVVGADRIAANGDVANKIGTYSVGGTRQRERSAVLRSRAGLDAGPESRFGRSDSDRAARRRGSNACFRRPSRAGGYGSRKSRVRRDAGALRDRDHHGARHRPSPV